MIQNLQKVASYDLTQSLRVGKTGAAFITTHQQSKAVLKVLNSSLRFDPAVQTMFFSELETITNLVHPNIARVLDFGEDGVRYFVVSEWVADGSLNSWLQLQTREQGLPDRHTAVELMRQIAEGLAFAHRKGAVHWQLEPENILLSKVGQFYNVKISDFGLARVVVQADSNGILVNDPKYISPEHVLGSRAEATSDMYSFGVLMFHAFTGSVPFQVRDLGEAANKHVYERPRSLRELDSQIPAELESLVLKCLQKRPADRPTAEEARDSLQGILERYYPSVRSTRILGSVERDSQTPNFEVPVGRSDFPRISVLDDLGQVLFVREIPPSSLTLGRDPGNSLVLESDTVSRNHLRLEYDGREVRVTDLSSNGTFLIGGSSAGGRLAFQTSTVFPWRGIIHVAPYWIRLEQPSSMAEPNRLAVTLERERFEFTPGVGVPLRFTVANLGAITDHLVFEVIGVPREWVTLPDKVQLNKGMQSTLVLSVNVPRSSEAVAREYSISVRARSLDKPDDFGEAHAVWLVLPFGQSSLQVRPGNRSARRKTQYSAVLRNESNVPLTIQLSASDDQSKFFFAFDEVRPPIRFPPGAKGVLMRWGQIIAMPFVMVFRTMVESTVGPMLRRATAMTRDIQAVTGQEEETTNNRNTAAPEIRVPVSTAQIIEPGQSHSFLVNTWVPWRIVGRSIQRSFEVNVETLQLEERWKEKHHNLQNEAKPRPAVAQLSHLAIFPIWVPPVIAAILALLAFILIRNPSIDKIQSVPEVVKAGQPFKLRCEVSSAVGVELFYDGNKRIKAKTCDFSVPGIQQPSNYTIKANNFLPLFGFGVATKDKKIIPKRTPRPASLEKFFVIGGATKLDIVEGQKRTLRLTCSGTNIVSLELQTPTGTRNFSSCQALAQEEFGFDEPSSNRFQLEAKGEANTAQPLAKIVVVKVVAAEPSITFSANPNTVIKGEGGEVVLSWRVVNASRVEISALGDVIPAGSQSIPAPSDSQTFVLKAKNFSLEPTRSVRITVVEPQAVVIQPPPVAVAPERPVVKQVAKPVVKPKPAIRPVPVRPSVQAVAKPVVKPKPIVSNQPVEQWSRYFTNFGFLELSSFDRMRYTNNFTNERSDPSKVVITDKRLYTEDGSINLRLSDSQRATFSGTATDGRWCGALANVPFPDDCGFSGKWTVRINGVECTLEAKQVNNVVTGTMCDGENLRRFSGSITIRNNRTELYAPFTANPNYQHLQIYIDGYESNQFRGTIGVSAGLTGINWCGWREGQSKPTDCGS